MSDESAFQKMDEDERIYAPEQLPAEEQTRVQAEEGAPQSLVDEEPTPEGTKPEPGATPGMLQEFGIGHGAGPVR